MARAIAIYTLVDPRTRRPFYVGQAVNADTRLESHIREAQRHPEKSPRKSTVINELRAAGLRPLLVVVKAAATPEEAAVQEAALLDHLVMAGFSMTNTAKPVRSRL